MYLGNCMTPPLRMHVLSLRSYVRLIRIQKIDVELLQQGCQALVFHRADQAHISAWLPDQWPGWAIMQKGSPWLIPCQTQSLVDCRWQIRTQSPRAPNWQWGCLCAGSGPQSSWTAGWTGGRQSHRPSSRTHWRTCVPARILPHTVTDHHGGSFKGFQDALEDMRPSPNPHTVTNHHGGSFRGHCKIHPRTCAPAQNLPNTVTDHQG